MYSALTGDEKANDLSVKQLVIILFTRFSLSIGEGGRGKRKKGIDVHAVLIILSILVASERGKSKSEGRPKETREETRMQVIIVTCTVAVKNLKTVE